MHFWWSANLYALTHVQTIVQRYSIQIKKAKFYLRAGCEGRGWGYGVWSVAGVRSRRASSLIVHSNARKYKKKDGNQKIAVW